MPGEHLAFFPTNGYKMILILVVLLCTATLAEPRLLRAGVAPFQGGFALGRAWTEEPVLTIPGSGFQFSPNETAFAAVALPLSTNPFTTISGQVIRSFWKRNYFTVPENCPAKQRPENPLTPFFLNLVLMQSLKFRKQKISNIFSNLEACAFCRFGSFRPVSYPKTILDAIIVISAADGLRAIKKGLNPLTYVAAAAKAGSTFPGKSID